jgi:hypothetical protein
MNFYTLIAVVIAVLIATIIVWIIVPRRPQIWGCVCIGGGQAYEVEKWQD